MNKPTLSKIVLVLFIFLIICLIVLIVINYFFGLVIPLYSIKAIVTALVSLLGFYFLFIYPE